MSRIGVWRLKLFWTLALGCWSFFFLARVFAVVASPTGATNTPSVDADQTHWSLKPVTRPTVPAMPAGKWKSRNPIDNFIFSKLAESRLSPSPEAPRRVLIRRLYFDLIGLPPTPAEVRAFERDPATNA